MMRRSVRRGFLRGRRGAAPVAAWAGVSLVVLGVCLLVLMTSGRPARGQGETVELFCAAGVQHVIEPMLAEIERETGVAVRVQYGGSGALLAAIELTRKGDLFLAADETYVELAEARGLVAERYSLARQTPVIVVRRGNPLGITGLGDLLAGKVRFALANPEAASIGRTVRDGLRSSGMWEALAAHCSVFTPTVTDVATAVQLGSVEAGIIWDTNVRQFEGLEAVAAPELSPASQRLVLALLSTARTGEPARRVAEYLSDPQRGLARFRQAGYEVIETGRARPAADGARP